METLTPEAGIKAQTHVSDVDVWSDISDINCLKNQLVIVVQRQRGLFFLTMSWREQVNFQ
jgi:hypothetical protein